MATSLQRPTRILIVSFVVSTVIAVVEIIGGVLSDSISLMSDAVHVFIDVMVIGLSLFAITIAARSHSSVMTFGYHS